MIHPVLVVLLVVQLLRRMMQAMWILRNCSCPQPHSNNLYQSQLWGKSELCGISHTLNFVLVLWNTSTFSKKQNQMASPTTNKRTMAAATTPRIGSNRGRRIA
jgi:hypothetical protein